MLAATMTLLSGCAAGQEPTAEPPRTVSPLPTLTRPTTPPSEPTDAIKATELIVGTVNRGGSGPCYGLVTDDGVQYALYEAKGRALTIGIRIKADVSPSMLDIACGAGTLVEVETLMPVG
ncbi:hypothetical protein AB0C12_22640 [Actinoplanes sp. NPDC048967]|uniref:hypothetical protein n=1 Tax=Actinoplanes sp. NPDC048967 TaxID=3155269 RepID=UPI0033C25612